MTDRQPALAPRLLRFSLFCYGLFLLSSLGMLIFGLLSVWSGPWKRNSEVERLSYSFVLLSLGLALVQAALLVFMQDRALEIPDRDGAPLRRAGRDHRLMTWSRRLRYQCLPVYLITLAVVVIELLMVIWDGAMPLDGRFSGTVTLLCVVSGLTFAVNSATWRGYHALGLGASTEVAGRDRDGD